MNIRNSNIEILRIFTMLFIVMGHMIEQSDAISTMQGLNLFWACFLGSGLRIAVNVFLMIGLWFLVSRTDIKVKRLIKLHGQMLFYLIPINGIIIAMGMEYDKIETIRCFFPFILRPVWFGSAYMALLLMCPFLALSYKRITQGGGGKIAVLVLMLFVLVCTLNPKMMDNWFCNVSWFAVMFFFVAYYKDCKVRVNKWMAIGISITLYVCLVMIKYYLMERQYTESIAFSYIDVWLKQLMSIPSLMISFGLFHFFVNTEMGKVKSVNWLAASTFAVYIVHQTPNFYPILWDKILRIQSWQHSYWFPIYLVLSVVVIYLVVGVVDWIRRKFFEPYYVNIHLVRVFCKKLEDTYKPLNNK